MSTNKWVNWMNIVVLFGIIWIMINNNSFYSYGKNAFPEKNNVMSTAIGTEMVFGQLSDRVSAYVEANDKSTIKNFLKIAIAPVGSTMYVWGGGWNEEDTGAGREARSIGLSPAWKNFAEDKDSGYNYRNYRYQIHDGLDCSGYVGWCVYNVLNTKDNGRGYVKDASKQAAEFAELGLGSYCSPSEVTNYQPGDIMSSACNCCGHVWIVVGTCEDGSVVLAHSSPPGVQLSGTVTLSGRTDSQAFLLAEHYMKTYYNDWYERYPAVCKNSAYLSHYGQMRWYTTGENAILSDPDGYCNMSAEEILEDLFNEK